MNLELVLPIISSNIQVLKIKIGYCSTTSTGFFSIDLKSAPPSPPHHLVLKLPQIYSRKEGHNVYSFLAQNSDSQNDRLMLSI